MKILNAKHSLVLLLFVLTSACTHTSPKYNPSAINVDQIRQLTKNSSIQIKDGAFSDPSQKKSIICRAAGPVVAPGGKSYAQYLKSAIFEEFKLAGIYNQKSSEVLSAKLDHIDFSSSITGASWTIRMTFNSPSVKPFTVSSTHDFPGSFIASQACQEVAQELSPATQKFILALVKHPSFKKLSSKKVALK